MKYKIMGMVFNFLSYIPFVLPVYKARVGVVESFEAVIRGFNLCEFSLWGSLLVFMPIIFYTISYLKIQHGLKNLSLILLYVINAVVVHFSTLAAHSWINENASGLIQSGPFMLFYLFSMFLGLVCICIHNYKYEHNEEQEE